MNKQSVYLVVISLLVSACSVNKLPVPTGGSRADGIIELSYEKGKYEIPVIDWDLANRTASERCQAWGYTRAEPFGGVKTLCLVRSIYGGCDRKTVTINYQCIGSQ